MNRAKALRRAPVIRTTPRALAVAAAVGGGMSTSRGTGTVQAVIQADLENAPPQTTPVWELTTVQACIIHLIRFRS